MVNESDEIDRILNEKKEAIERKKQEIENCKIPYVEVVAKLSYPNDFLEVTNIDSENFIVVRNGSKLRALCRDCERKGSLVEGDYAELAKFCLTVSEGVWVRPDLKPQQHLRHDNTLRFKEHAHQSYKTKGKQINTYPFMQVKLKNAEQLYQIWLDCWERMNKQR